MPANIKTCFNLNKHALSVVIKTSTNPLLITVSGVMFFKSTIYGIQYHKLRKSYNINDPPYALKINEQHVRAPSALANSVASISTRWTPACSSRCWVFGNAVGYITAFPIINALAA